MTHRIDTPRDMYLLEAEARHLRAETMAGWGRAFGAWVVRHLPGRSHQTA